MQFLPHNFTHFNINKLKLKEKPEEKIFKFTKKKKKNSGQPYSENNKSQVSNQNSKIFNLQYNYNVKFFN